VQGVASQAKATAASMHTAESAVSGLTDMAENLSEVAGRRLSLGS